MRVGVPFLSGTLFFLSSASGSPAPPGQQPLSEAAKELPFSSEWFLLHTQHHQEIVGKAIFYTHGAGDAARQVACSNPDQYVTIWDIWPKEFYDDTKHGRFYEIHADEELRRKFYTGMSEAYASLARSHAVVMHSRDEFEDPPKDGIWGMTELPALKAKTDVAKLAKVKHDEAVRGQLPFQPLERSAEEEKLARISIEQVKMTLARAKDMIHDLWKPESSIVRRREESPRSCRYWDSRMLKKVDSLF